MSLYTLQFYGDLPTKAPNLCNASRVFESQESALNWLRDHLALDTEDENVDNHFWFDCEDDRIVIWEISPDNEIAKAVWHASGWHWQNDANDLPGGPLEQGTLPGDSESLYARASYDE